MVEVVCLLEGMCSLGESKEEEATLKYCPTSHLVTRKKIQ